MYELDLLCFASPFRFDLAAIRRYADAVDAVVVVAETDHMLSGFVILNLMGTRGSSSYYVTTLDVHPSWRRHGIATRLLAEAEGLAVYKGVKVIDLHVFCGNEAAIAFYAGQSFTRGQRYKDFYGSSLDAWGYSKVIAV